MAFYCPGCRQMHQIKIDAKTGWTFDGNYDRPTFSPSILVQGVKPMTDEEYARIMAGEKIEPKPKRCHTFVTAGRIQFLSDCLHDLAGQTVDMPGLPPDTIEE